MSKFPDRIKQLRKEHNMTQDDLAERLGLKKSSISMYENGKRKPDFESICALSDIFRVSMDYLLGTSDDKNFHEMTEAELNELALSDPYNRSELPLTRKDKKDIQDALDEMKQQLLDGDLLFDGNPVSDEDSAAIIAAMETAMTIVKLKNKETYRRKKE